MIVSGPTASRILPIFEYRRPTLPPRRLDHVGDFAADVDLAEQEQAISQTRAHTKTNRCIAEGRRAFLERFAEIYGDRPRASNPVRAQGGKGTEPVPTSRRKRRAARGASSVAEVQ
jgi:hypothetical protein